MNSQIELVDMSKDNFIPLKKAKQYLRIEHNIDDEIIEEMLEIAVIAAENYIGLSLKESTWKLIFYNNLPSKIRFKNGPVNKVISVKLYNIREQVNELSENDFYFNKAREELFFKTNHFIEKAEVIYRAGYFELPAPIRQGILEHLVKLYDLRGSDQALPLSAKSLYQAYKRVKI
jgi:uncharacterized phiE125 gp8 family phage protein